MSEQMSAYDLEELRAKLAPENGKRYWRSLGELADDAEFRKFVESEFPEPAEMLDTPVTRRAFLKVMGASLALAGLNACTREPTEKIFPYERKANGFYDPEEVFRDFIKASKGTDADLTGILEVEKETGKSPYQQIKDLRGIQWPAPTAAIAKAGGTKRRYMGQEEAWPDKPYAEFRHTDGKMHFHMCHQDYSEYREVTDELARVGTEKGYYISDHYDLLIKARDMGLTPELPHDEHLGKKIGDCPKDKYPFWFATGVVYEHFHTAKTIRAGTTKKLVPEMYVEMHPDDARELGTKDGEWVKITTRRGSIEARVSVGLDSVVKPARNTVPKGFLFCPWNLSVADSADPKKNKWLANGTTHRAFDPVSGQADFKKCAARIEAI